MLPTWWLSVPRGIFALQMTAPLASERQADVKLHVMIDVGDAVPGGRLADFGDRLYCRGAVKARQTLHEGGVAPVEHWRRHVKRRATGQSGEMGSQCIGNTSVAVSRGLVGT
ncbi:hypothetical protein DE146DRAFT_110875 [Phaeosphaeria sp. MPI-PUGE-AT-0046c]|nr:hypothetical protein DE146DRAFT_110875 [Phaeosphaeria sp. MPI-PUGE-AT-0046c]